MTDQKKYIQEKPLKSIEELNGFTFFVEDYQRGFKWEKQQICDLLNDIKDFKGEDIYCLQPVVVKKLRDNFYELIDGQQRYTTIYMILSYFGGHNFNIEYNTRKRSGIFLSKIIATGHAALKENENLPPQEA